MEMGTCSLYGRVSTQRQAVIEEGGLDTPFNLMDKQIEFEDEKDQETKWEITDRYREEGWLGKNLGRPEFKRPRYITKRTRRWQVLQASSR